MVNNFLKKAISVYSVWDTYLIGKEKERYRIEIIEIE